MSEVELLVHYWQLPDDIFISLKQEFHQSLCLLAQSKINHRFKNCFHKILDCPKWHAQRLFNRNIRFTLYEFEILREYLGITKEETEQNIETIGNHEDGTIITNPKFPFHLKDLFYVASHLMFDGSYRDKKGDYFYSYEDTLTDYHRERLSKFGEVPINFIEKENQLYFSYTVGYIASRILEIYDFKSKTCKLSTKFKDLAKRNKVLADEVIKALIIDESDLSEKIRAEINNKTLSEELIEIFSVYYKLNSKSSRTRKIKFTIDKYREYDSISYKIEFNSDSFIGLYKSISPLPILYKEKGLAYLCALKSKKHRRWKEGDIKKLIVKSLFLEDKSILELAFELVLSMSAIRANIKGRSKQPNSLISMNIVNKTGERILRKGAYSKVDIYGLKNKSEAINYLSKP